MYVKVTIATSKIKMGLQLYLCDVVLAKCKELHVKLMYMLLYSTGHRQCQNETCSNAFGGQTQTRLRSPRPSNAGNSQALKA